MLQRREKKTLPFREQIIVDRSEEAKTTKEITHLRFTQSVGTTPEGVYAYNPVTEIVSSLDDEMIGRLPLNHITKKANASSIDVLRHIPTWNKMIEDGEVVDNRTKKEEEDTDASDADTQEAVAIAPRRRGLSL